MFMEAFLGNAFNFPMARNTGVLCISYASRVGQLLPSSRLPFFSCFRFSKTDYFTF